MRTSLEGRASLSADGPPSPRLPGRSNAKPGSGDNGGGRDMLPA